MSIYKNIICTYSGNLWKASRDLCGSIDGVSEICFCSFILRTLFYIFGILLRIPGFKSEITCILKLKMKFRHSFSKYRFTGFSFCFFFSAFSTQTQTWIYEHYIFCCFWRYSFNVHHQYYKGKQFSDFLTVSLDDKAPPRRGLL